mmetsp:Transcript_87611/g.152532  ORF Transcript_87611/g.152532 Transcript_87611/m.152532 type:complete len:330 (-) Transcript_87611:60-1049(-)
MPVWGHLGSLLVLLQALLVGGYGIGREPVLANHTVCQAQWAKKMAYLQESKMARHTPCMKDKIPGVSSNKAIVRPTGERASYDGWWPEWACDSLIRLPKGMHGDGAKWMCGIDALGFAPAAGAPLLYSLGVGGETFWEAAMHRHIPNLEVHLVDPTGKGLWDEEVRGRLHLFGGQLHDWWIYGRSSHCSRRFREPKGKDSFNYKSCTMPVVHNLDDLKRRLGHEGRQITFLKVDVEGAEYTFFQEMMRNCSRTQPLFLHLNIELHGTNCRQHQQFFNIMDRCGYRIVAKETNHWGCDGYKCVEYTLISDIAAQKEYADTHGCHGVDMPN